MCFQACSTLYASAAVNRDTRRMKAAMAKNIEGARLTRRWTAALRDYREPPFHLKALRCRARRI